MASLEGVSLEFTAGFTAGDRTLLSSVGGFSQPNRRQIKSLQELLGTIRPLGLEFVYGHSLQEQKWLGEGVSYKVFKCLQRSTGKVVAVKQIKLPSASSQEAFDRQVACVLRDIEVMSHGPLAGHENVVNILGYGWNFRGSGSIPFLVTEYASSGTLRDYLRRYRLPSRDRLLMCVNVARGLHELHMCGIVHGDLKLDNVLVTAHTSAQSGPQGMSQSVVAKISDFGHSLLLYEDDEAKEDQKYGGTLAYNAPEIAKSHGLEYESLNFRKCDVWALGLLCWEALDNGSPYYKSTRIQDLIAITRTDSSSRSPSDHSASASKGSTSTSKGTASTPESILGSLSTLASRLQEVAIDFLDSESVGDLYSFEKGKLRELFQATLDVDPDHRVADIPMLPLLLKDKTGTGRSRLGQSSSKSAEWSFEVFRPAQVAQIPHAVKEQILNDCRRLGSEAGRSIASAQAAFHVSIAYILGFGTDVDISQALEWATKSGSKGFQDAATLHEFITETYVNDRTSDPLESQQRYTRIIRDSFRRAEIPYLDAIPSAMTLSYGELKRIAADHARDNRENDIQTPFYFAHYAVRHGITEFLNEQDSINLQSHSTGETALALACKLGDVYAVHNLINVGADSFIAAYDGCLPIHFICMFPPESMKVAAYLLLKGPSEPSRNVTPVSTKSEMKVTLAKVKYEFHPRDYTEITLIPNELIVVLEAVDEEWWKGTNLKGEIGLFPRMFVELVEGEEPKLAETSDDSPPEPGNEASEDMVGTSSDTPLSPASLGDNKGEKSAKKKPCFPTPQDYHNADVWFIENKSAVPYLFHTIAKEPRSLHRQFPLQLVGTPLAFAVAVASQEAVELILHLHANSIMTVIGPSGWPPCSRNSSPIHLATSLHLVNILELLIADVQSQFERTDCLESAWRSLADTSTVERTFIHGRHAQRAMRDMITSLRGQLISAIPPEPMLTTQSLIISSIEMGDIAIANAGLVLPERSDDGTVESRLSVENRNLLMLMCTKAASSGAFDASKSFEFLEFALSRGSHVDCGLGGVEGQRAINTAIEYHRIEILDWFIQKGASLNVKDCSGSYPLHYLIRSGFSGTYSVKKLLEAGADPNAREGDTAPLHLAIRNNRLEDVSQLLEGGADPTLLCEGGDGDLVSALHYAVKMGNLEIVSLLVKRQTSEAMSPSAESPEAPERIELLKQLDGHGNTPLLTASQRGNVEIVNFLLEAGAETSPVNESGFLCIHCAAIGRHDALLPVLAQKMDVNSKTLGGSTALHIVSRALRQDTDAASRCCSALIQAGADPTLQDSNGKTSLSFIATNLAGNDDDQLHQIRRSLLDLMVEKHINLNFPSAGSCMIHQAIDNHDAIFVQDLLERGVSVDALDNAGWSPLRQCVNMGQGTSFKKPGVILASICDIATNLIAKGADIYRVDSKGLSLLVHAVLSGNAPMVHLLLEYFEQGISRQPARLGNTLKPPIETRPPSTASIPSTKTSKRASLIGKFKQVVKPKEAPVPEESRLKSKEMAEERFRRIGSIDREIIITAWQTAVLQARWDCVSAFIDRNLHGDTDSVKHPIGLGLLRYALEEEIASVLMAFMGSHRHMVSDILVEARNPDPVLLDIWMRVCNRAEKQRGKDLGEHSIKRCAYLVENSGFTPFLDFPSLLEKGYIEAQSEGPYSKRPYDGWHCSLKEVYSTDKEEQTEAPVIALFNEEEDDNEDPFDEEVQMQLNSLIPKMCRFF